MNRFSAPLRWRNLRWVLCAAVVPALWACNTRKLKAPDGAPSQVVQAKVLQSQNHKLDLLFMVDDSSSMKPLQAKMTARLPDFMQRLKSLPGGLPDIHVAVVSSSLGAGAFGDVPGCGTGAPGDDGGSFQHKAGCGLNAGENYIKASQDATTNNFTGNIEDVFSCIALLGDGGCGFEHQFESTRQALIRATDPNDANNGGFLRADAFLGIVMLTNEDDCSVPANSELFNTSVSSLSDQPPLGGLWSYRCNEFGHKCTQPLPHTAAGLPMTLTGCVSKENTDGLYHLTPVAEFAAFLNQLKAPDKPFLAIIGGPYDDATNPYVVKPRVAQLATGGTEMQPEIGHSCMQAAGEYADPGVRELALVNAMGGVFLPICANDFQPALTQIADTLGKKLGVQCVNGMVTNKADGSPDCDVILRTTLTATTFHDDPVANCSAAGPGAVDKPCWQWGADTDGKCPAGHVLQLCYGAGCAAAPMSGNATNAILSCAVTLPPP
jgi:hypothetical protein